MDSKYITVRGVRVHNLKNIDLKIPRDKLVIFTGISGSGKSSLAFDTIYAEGHRRFVESLSSYARMFLGQLDKPDIDSIEGLSPAISIDQKTTSRNPRSTVGTVTEIYDYLRLLYARCGIPHCPVCGREIVQQTTDQIIDSVLKLEEKTRFLVLAPVVRDKKGRHEKVIEDAKKSGFVRLRIDGSMYEIGEEIKLDKNKKHKIDVVVDRLVIKPNIRERLSDSVETALSLSDGNLIISVLDRDGNETEEMSFSQNYACEEHGISVTALEPRMFSFNNPMGACPDCAGIGEKRVISFDRLIPDKTLSLRGGAVVCNGFKSIDDDTWMGPLFKAVGEKHNFTLDTPICDYSDSALQALAYGTGDEVYSIVRSFDGVVRHQDIKYSGLVGMIQLRFDQTQDEYYEQFVEEIACHTCKGKRLKPEVLAVTVGGMNIDQVCSMSVKEAIVFFDNLELNEVKTVIAKEILKEIKSRLRFLDTVGLDYLNLSRRAGTLSGGEAQRIRLATQIGSGLVGVAYILDEPSIGLHQRDNDKLLNSLKGLKDLGNTLIVVEHDEDTMRAADYIVDIGPGAGEHGGQVIAQGTAQEIMQIPESITGQYLSGKIQIPVPATRRKPTGWLTVKGAAENNLKNIDVKFPLGVFTCVTGVSGSGKSSLVNEILYKYLAKQLNRARTIPGKFKKIEGVEQLDKVIDIDQSPIGRTPRSNPATYTGVFDQIRDLFASTVDAKAKGYTKGRFSFNVKGGRCEACGGDGIIKIEMHFLPDVYVPCEVCQGKRYNRETLDVKYKGKSIYDVLDMTVEEALEFFDKVPSIRRKIETLNDVGLSYIKLGQPSTTLSGGEAQRIKLATELSRRSTGKTIYILDEPTTGLHFADVHKLVEILQRLAEGGNSVVVIEHNLDVIKTADYIIDIGPEGGDGGGTVIAQGTPEHIAQCPNSYTGIYVKKMLEKAKDNQ